MKQSLLIAAACLTGQSVALCSGSPASMQGFDSKKFAGNWFMQASTLYANDEIGCVKLSISEPDADSDMYAALRAV